MEEKTVKFCWFLPESERDLQLPGYASDGAAGMDVAAAVVNDTVIKPGEIRLIPTGFGVSLPIGYELQVRPRSGLAIKHGITVINSPGTIDSDYRGEIMIALMNLGLEPFTVHRGDRIAQLILATVIKAQFVEVQELDSTVRDSGGFGHTGV